MSMKLNALGYSALVAVALLTSCSSDDDKGGNGAGGSSAGTGASAGGKGGSSSAGSSSTAGSSGKAGAGGTNAGGTSSTAGSGFGGFNFGGSGFNPGDYECDPVPQPGTACTSAAEPCLDGAKVCFCSMDEWSCMDLLGGGGGAPGGEFECPSTKPMTGSACDAFSVCPYEQGAYCACDGTTWTCN